MLQQNWYNDDQRYLKWIIKNPYKVFLQPDMFFVVLLIIVAGIVFYRYATKDKREEKEKIDREKVRSSAKTWALAEALCKEFLSDGHCFKRLCDPNVATFTIEVSKEVIIAKTS